MQGVVLKLKKLANNFKIPNGFRKCLIVPGGAVW